MIKAVKQVPLTITWKPTPNRWQSWSAEVEGEVLLIHPAGKGSKLYHGYINYNFINTFTNIDTAKTHLERLIKNKLRNY
jgi:hypothetical protein